MKTVDLRKTILKTFHDNEFYGYEVYRKLASQDLKVDISRLYKILGQMMKEHCLEGRWEKSDFGPRKRVYRLGEKGRNELNDILSDAIGTVHDFYGQYLLRLPPETNVFDCVCGLLAGRLSDKGIIAFIASKYSVMLEKMIHAFHSKASTLYFIKPSSVTSGVESDDVILLKGDYLDVPLKDGYIDLLLVIDTPPRDTLKESVKEWHRTLKKSGSLAVLIPTTFIRTFQDPLTIGDFLEQYEHKLTEKKVDKNFLKLSLGKLFDNVEEKQIVHMTLFVASGPRSSR